MTIGQPGRLVASAHVAGSETTRRGVWRLAAVCMWAVLVVTSLSWLAAYSFTLGAVNVPPSLDDVGPPLATDGKQFLIVMAIHPHCPCSRASIGELTRLLTRHPTGLRCVFLVYRPQHANADWMESDLVEAARKLPQAVIVPDDAGRYAALLGMTTSGGVVLYSPRGEKEYFGGITPARSHWGDNVDSDAIRVILSGDEPPRRTAPEYECPIREASA